MGNDSLLCFNMANSFYDIGRLANEYDKEEGTASILFACDAFYAIPAIVNLAFACELYLKALLYQSGFVDAIRNHNLNELFCKLPDSTQGQMENEFAARSRYPITLKQILEIHSKAFENWRYAYEPEKENIEAYLGNLQLAVEIIRDAFKEAN